MEDIRLIEGTDEYLVLESANGEKFRLLIDDDVRSATRKKLAFAAVSDTMTPREIQQQIRGGASVAQIAAQTGLSEELVSKFAAPVLDEIAYVIGTAQAIRLSIAGARPNTTDHVEFGEVIAGRLRASGATMATWRAVKLEGSAWRVSVDFGLGDQAHSAEWVFEPKKLTLAPENDMAIRLSTEEVLTAIPTSGLRVISTDTSAIAEVPIAAVVAELDHETVDVELEHQVEVDAAATTDLLDAMRRKRENRKIEPAITEPLIEPPAQTSAVEDANPPVEDESAAPEEAEPIADAKPSQQEPVKKTRASMPSWDQIVFGAKADD